MTSYKQNCLLFLSSKNCSVLFTNVPAFYLQQMKTVPQSVRKRLREKSLFNLKQSFFQLLKLLKYSRNYSPSFSRWAFGESTGTRCHRRLPAPERQRRRLPSLQSKVQNWLDGGFHERRTAQRLKSGFFKDCWKWKRRHNNYFFYSINWKKKKATLTVFFFMK